jgi:hypothetical protein
MGFMDKAKKLAEQAQTKLDEVQTQFNEKGAGSTGPDGGPAVDYDKHGRPVPSTPAEAATPPHGDPVAGSAPSAPPAPPAAPTPDASAPPSPSGPSATEDPNKPSYEPPKMSSGDPLAG